jgi:preprotein translocase subunit SecG
MDNRSIPREPTSFWQAPAKLRLIAIIVLIITTIGLGLINGYLHLPETKVLYGMYGAQVFLRYAIVGAAGAFLISTIGLGVLYQYRIRSRL